tara:strand:+ start:2105 stop:2494 length:390 start_codon:yes stop_codon:yes gene_type:complete
MTPSFEHKRTRLLVTAISSATFYGGWALFVNWNTESRVASTTAQALCSFIAGYYVASLVEFVFGLLERPWRVPIASTVPYFGVLGIFAGIHYWIGTPHILYTLLPNIIVGTAYFILYCVKLEKFAVDTV